MHAPGLTELLGDRRDVSLARAHRAQRSAGRRAWSCADFGASCATALGHVDTLAVELPARICSGESLCLILHVVQCYHDILAACGDPL